MQYSCKRLCYPDYPGDPPEPVYGSGLGLLYLYVATFDSYRITDHLQRE